MPVVPSSERIAPGVPINKTDLSQTTKLAIACALSWLVPFERLAPVARRITPSTGRRLDGRVPAEAAIARLLDGRVPAAALPGIAAAWRARKREAQMQILALRRPGRRWLPSIRWHGDAHLAAALARGRGAILWVGDFVYSSLVTKMAFAARGDAVSHLSRPEHGFSASPFGVRYLNPIWTSVENRFIAERVMIVGDNARAALDMLRARLAHNAVVSITVWNKARRHVDVGFLGGAIRLATGPAHLSFTTGAPLLPVFTLRGEDGVYDLHVGPPLAGDAAGEYANAHGAVARAYAAMLERFVLASPDQWNGWANLVAPPYCPPARALPGRGNPADPSGGGPPD